MTKTTKKCLKTKILGQEPEFCQCYSSLYNDYYFSVTLIYQLQLL